MTGRPQISLWSIFLRSSQCHAWRVLLTVFSTRSLLAVLQEIMTETGIRGRIGNEACGRSILRSIRGPFWSILVNSNDNLMGTSWKPHGNLIKPVIKPVIKQSYGRANVKQCQTVPNSAKTAVYSTPLGSPTGVPKLSYVHARADWSQGEVVGVQWCAGPAGP